MGLNRRASTEGLRLQPRDATKASPSPVDGHLSVLVGVARLLRHRCPEASPPIGALADSLGAERRTQGLSSWSRSGAEDLDATLTQVASPRSALDLLSSR